MSSQATMQINLDDRMSFAQETISKDQAKGRWKILGIEQTRLKKIDATQDLSPRSLDEKKQLGAAIQEKNPPHSIRIALDDEGLFYDIEMRTNTNLATLTEINAQANSMRLLGDGSSEKGILMAIEKPDDNLKWYQTATKKQIRGVFCSDFLDALELGYITNLNLMSAARHLQMDPKVGPKLIALYFQAYNLYQEHLDFNRACERLILNSAKCKVGTINALRKLLNNCGEKCDAMPKGFLESCNHLVGLEIEQNLTFYGSILSYGQQIF